MSARKLKVVPSAKASAQPATANAEYVEHPLDTAVVILDDAHATLDLLYTLAVECGEEADTGLGLCGSSLTNSLDGVMRRIAEARTIVEKLPRLAPEQRS